MEVAHHVSTSASIEEIRNKFNPTSTEYRGYINSFYEHSQELTDIFIAKPDLLLRWDDLMSTFNTNDLSTGKVSQTSRKRMKDLLDEVSQSASAPLQSSINRHLYEIDHFPDTMAFLLFSFYFF